MLVVFGLAVMGMTGVSCTMRAYNLVVINGMSFVGLFSGMRMV